MKLDYFDLISPSPIFVSNIGSIVSPRLGDISKIGKRQYSNYMSLLLIDVSTFLKSVGIDPEPIKDIEQLNVFDLLVENVVYAQQLENMFNFFIAETVEYNQENSIFLVIDDVIEDKKNVIGFINRDNFGLVTDLICQRIYIKSNRDDEDLSKIKSSKARAIMEKLLKGRKQKEKQSKQNEDMELGNIISAVANKHNSLNFVNIWDLTVYQLWDSFARLSNNNIYDIQSMSVAAYGNKDNHFDVSTWFKRINNDG